MPYNFSYVIPEKLAGSAEPGGSYKPLREDLADMAKMGITAIVTLTEFTLDEEILKEFDFAVLHLPIQDFTPPSLEQIDRFVDFVDTQLARENGKVVAHCWAGQGRTGTLLACYFVSEGLTAAEAIDLVRLQRPGSIETEKQMKSIADYEQWLRDHKRFGKKKKIK